MGRWFIASSNCQVHWCKLQMWRQHEHMSENGHKTWSRIWHVGPSSRTQWNFPSCTSSCQEEDAEKEEGDCKETSCKEDTQEEEEDHKGQEASFENKENHYKEEASRQETRKEISGKEGEANSCKEE